MRRDEWARLAAPFPSHALDWCVAQLDREGSTARLEPVVSEAAVVERLDSVLGVEGWSIRLLPLGPDAVVCELALLGVHKSAVARTFAGQLAMERVTAWALGRAAGLCGMRPPTTRGAWVDFDLDVGEPVFLPEAEPSIDRAVGPDVAREADAGASGTGDVPPTPTTAPSQSFDGPEGAPAEGGPVDGGHGDGGHGDGGHGDGGRVDRASDDSAAADAGAGGVTTRSEGQQAIERLVDRLRAEGFGREAAALVVEHGGYGRSAEEARELYRRLRELLLQKGAVS